MAATSLAYHAHTLHVPHPPYGATEFHHWWWHCLCRRMQKASPSWGRMSPSRSRPFHSTGIVYLYGTHRKYHIFQILGLVNEIDIGKWKANLTVSNEYETSAYPPYLVSWNTSEAFILTLGTARGCGSSSIFDPFLSRSPPHLPSVLVYRYHGWPFRMFHDIPKLCSSLQESVPQGSSSARQLISPSISFIPEVFRLDRSIWKSSGDHFLPFVGLCSGWPSYSAVSSASLSQSASLSTTHTFLALRPQRM